jgi:LacI family transcriptional regulator
MNVHIRIKDIAKIAGVSSATVSLVLNEKPGVGEEKRAEILKIAKELGYQRPKSGKSGQQEEAGTICFLHIARHGHIVNRDHDVFITDYIEGLSRGCEDAGYSLQISTFKTTSLEKIIEFCHGVEADGLIILGTELSWEDVASFREINKPQIFIDTLYTYLDVDFVDMNNEDSVHAVVKEFVENGHKEIGIVNGSPETPNLRLRKKEFKSSLAYYGLEYREEHSFTVDPTFHGAYNDMNRLLKQGVELPSALFCVNDIIACGCLRAFREFGVKIPDDLSIIGFDDLPLAAIADPPLTTISVSKARIGQTAVRLLNERIISKNRASISKVVISGKLVRRQSVRKLEDRD